MPVRRYVWTAGVSFESELPEREALASVEGTLDAINKNDAGPRVWLDDAEPEIEEEL